MAEQMANSIHCVKVQSGHRLQHVCQLSPQRLQFPHRSSRRLIRADRLTPGEGPGNYSGSVSGLVMDSRLAQPRGKLRQSAGIANLARVVVGNSLPSPGTVT
jgi:hypothetical protein